MHDGVSMSTTAHAQCVAAVLAVSHGAGAPVDIEASTVLRLARSDALRRVASPQLVSQVLRSLLAFRGAEAEALEAAVLVALSWDELALAREAFRLASESGAEVTCEHAVLAALSSPHPEAALAVATDLGLVPALAPAADNELPVVLAACMRNPKEVDPNCHLPQIPRGELGVRAEVISAIRALRARGFRLSLDAELAVFLLDEADPRFVLLALEGPDSALSPSDLSPLLLSGLQQRYSEGAKHERPDTDAARATARCRAEVRRLLQAGGATMPPPSFNSYQVEATLQVVGAKKQRT